MILRSMLIVPASSERFLARAGDRGADAIILDLEDGVAPFEKRRARENLVQAVPLVGSRGAVVFIRINNRADLVLADAEAACRAGAFGLVVPKVRTPVDLIRIAEHLEPIELQTGLSALRLIALIEDPGAVFDARAIATATPRVLGLSAGGEDLALALGAEPVPEVLRLPKMMVHMAARAAGVMSFGLFKTVADFNDIEGMRAAARESRLFGFDGASCIHPQVVPILNEAFTPSDAEIEKARAILAAFEASLSRGEGAVAFEGRMLDEPVVARARAVLARTRG